ncbi:MAG: hypothetical protein ACRDO8_09565 [Nocardioidaceae bacterium]
MESRPIFGHTIEFYRARLAALDRWHEVEDAMAASPPVPAVEGLLGVTELGARAVVAMAERPLPERTEIESRLRMLEDICHEL